RRRVPVRSMGASNRHRRGRRVAPPPLGERMRSPVRADGGPYGQRHRPRAPRDGGQHTHGRFRLSSSAGVRERLRGLARGGRRQRSIGLMSARILFVDDEPNVLSGFERLFRKEFSIETALGGEMALVKIAKSGPYAVIISDMRMPGMSGS